MEVVRQLRVMLSIGLLLVPASVRATDAVPPGPAVVLERVIALAQEHGLNARQVDWPAVSLVARQRIEQDPSQEGLSSAIRLVLRSLNDGHSFYRALPAGRPPVSGTTIPSPSIAVASRSPAGTPLLAVNGWSGDRVAERQALSTARAALNDALSTATCGLIVDLSQNRGGNMWPMVGGLLPLFSAGPLEFFMDRDGQGTRISASGASVLINGAPHYLTAGPLPQPAHLPRFIAVLLGPRTASSGELTAVAFKGQDNVRFFGQPTAGASTSNKSFGLPNGGMLAITHSRVLDRAGVAYEGRLQPDVLSDHPVAAADAWLDEQCRAEG